MCDGKKVANFEVGKGDGSENDFASVVNNIRNPIA